MRVCACSFLYLLQYQLDDSRGLFAIVVTLSLSSVYRRLLLLLLLVSQPTHDETTARLNVGCAHRRGCCTHTGNGKAMQLLAHPPTLYLSLCHSRSLDFCSRKETCSSCQCWAGRVACVSFECRIKHMYAHFAVVVWT